MKKRRRSRRRRRRRRMRRRRRRRRRRKRRRRRRRRRRRKRIEYYFWNTLNKQCRLVIYSGYIFRLQSNYSIPVVEYSYKKFYPCTPPVNNRQCIQALEQNNTTGGCDGQILRSLIIHARSKTNSWPGGAPFNRQTWTRTRTRTRTRTQTRTQTRTRTRTEGETYGRTYR